MRYAGRLPLLAEVRPSSVDKKSRHGETAVRLCNYTDVYYNAEIHPGMDLMEATAPAGQIERLRLEVGDVVITKDSESPDDIGVPAILTEVDGNMVCAYHLTLLRPDQSAILPKYLYWTLLSGDVADHWMTHSFGVTRFSLTAPATDSLRIPLPSLDTQRAIADYLDRETAEIDAMAAELDELLSLLHSRSFRLLLDVYSDLADGRTPLTSLKYVLSKLDRPVEGESGIVTAFRDGQVTLRSKRREAGFTNSERNDGYQGVEVGDVVFHGLDGFAGACGVSDSHGSSSPVYHVCRTGDAVYPEFIARMLRSMGMSGLLAAYSWSVRQRAVDYRNWAVFGSLKVPAPPRDEQRRIVEHLDEVTAEIDSMIADAQELKALLAERRSALITEVVTGRKEVPVS